MTAEEPTFDKDGYPTDETLRVIEEWPMATFNDATDALAYVRKAWYYPERWVTAKRRTRGSYKRAPLRRKHYVSTGGWSGNESLISAMERNFLLWALIWIQSRRGGHYIFEVRDE